MKAGSGPRTGTGNFVFDKHFRNTQYDQTQYDYLVVYVRRLTKA